MQRIHVFCFSSFFLLGAEEGLRVLDEYAPIGPWELPYVCPLVFDDQALLPSVFLEFFFLLEFGSLGAGLEVEARRRLEAQTRMGR